MYVYFVCIYIDIYPRVCIVCICIYIYICMHIMNIFIHICVYDMHMCTHTHTHTHTYIYIYIHIIYAYMYIDVSAYNVCIFVCICMYFMYICCVQYWTSSGGNTPQSSCDTATDHPSRKLSKLDEPDIQDTAGEVELISDVLLWTPSHGRAKAGRTARTYIQQLCVNTRYYPEDMPEAMDDREGWRERERERERESPGYPCWWRDMMMMKIMYMCMYASYINLY